MFALADPAATGGSAAELVRADNVTNTATRIAKRKKKLGETLLHMSLQPIVGGGRTPAQIASVGAAGGLSILYG